MRLLKSLPALLIAGPALAHTGAGHVDSLASGFAHPFAGFDHLLAMVLVGVWASLIGGARAWAWPAAFVAAMVAGGLTGLAGLPMPGVETLIGLSVIGLGLLVAFHVAVPVALGAALIAAFGIVHGHAHGAEAAGASFLPYALGFVAATALLHGLGLIGARAAGPLTARLAGGAAAVAGLVLVLS